MQVVLLAFAALWAVLLVDAWRLGQPDRLPRRDRRGLLVLLLALLLVLPGGAAYAGMNVGAARAAMSSVFASGEAAGAVDGRYNILLLGGDSGAGRAGLRPDSIQLASVDAESGRAVLFGFSRETENIRFRPGSVMAGLMPQGWTCGDECLLNGLYTWGTDHRKRVPGRHQGPRPAGHHRGGRGAHRPGHPVLRARRPQGLQEPRRRGGRPGHRGAARTPIGSQYEIKGWIKAGNQHLDGYQALWYARSRANSTNYERMARQRCVVTAMVRQLDPQTIVLHFSDIAKATKGVFRTDIPQEALASLATLAVKTKTAEDHLGQLRPAAHQALELRPAGRARHRGQRRSPRPSRPTSGPPPSPPPRAGTATGQGDGSRRSRRSRPSWTARPPTPTPTPRTWRASAR